MFELRYQRDQSESLSHNRELLRCGVLAEAGKPLAEFLSRCRSMRRLNLAANPLLKNAVDYFGELALPHLRSSGGPGGASLKL